MTIVLAGGSGFIGTQLARKLLTLGDTVVIIDKVAPKFTHEHLFFIQCDTATQQLPFNVLEHTDAVVNLVGAPIGGKKWTPAYKQVLKTSRIESTRHIVESMRSATSRPTILINASAVGYYGNSTEMMLTEHSPKGVGFLSDVVELWEQQAYNAQEFGTRVVCMRTAPVVGHGGMLAQLLRSARFGFLFMLSKKEFWQPWIHEEDIVNAYIFALQTSTLQGSVNAVAPEAVTHQTFMKELAHVVHRPILGVLPTIIKRIFFGTELINELTNSQRVSPQLLIDKGFVFQYPTIEGALRSVVQK